MARTADSAAQRVAQPVVCENRKAKVRSPGCPKFTAEKVIEVAAVVGKLRRTLKPLSVVCGASYVITRVIDLPLDPEDVVDTGWLFPAPWVLLAIIPVSENQLATSALKTRKKH